MCTNRAYHRLGTVVHFSTNYLRKKMGKKTSVSPIRAARAFHRVWWGPAASRLVASHPASRAGRVAQPAGHPDLGGGPARFPAWLATRLATWLATWRCGHPAGHPTGGWPWAGPGLANRLALRFWAPGRGPARASRPPSRAASRLAGRPSHFGGVAEPLAGVAEPNFGGGSQPI